MMRDLIIERDTLRLDGNTLSVVIRMPWYRALPLSSFCDLGLDVDGVSVDPETIHFLVNGNNYAAAELPPLYDQWWFVADDVVLSGELSDEAVASLDLSKEHEVHVVLALYLPYLYFDNGNQILKITEGDRKTMKIEKSAA